MAGAAVSGRLNWLTVTVTGVREDTPGVRTITLDVPGWEGHRAGQSVDVRLTAADGYRTQRPYSIASAPDDEAFELCVEHLPAGEVSPWLAGELRPGDQFELRGPGGRSFSWHADDGGPLLLVGGGAGIVPLRAMVRHALAAGRTDVTVVLSARTRASLLFADEVAAWPNTTITYTREGGRAARRPDARRRRPGAARLRLRSDGVRRARDDAAARGRPRRRSRSRRALRWSDMKLYTLLGADGVPYQSPEKGEYGGHARTNVYGTMDCPVALSLLRRGFQPRHRVFFADEATAIAAGFRPCGACQREKYRAWKAGERWAAREPRGGREPRGRAEAARSGAGRPRAPRPRRVSTLTCAAHARDRRPPPPRGRARRRRGGVRRRGGSARAATTSRCRRCARRRRPRRRARTARPPPRRRRRRSRSTASASSEQVGKLVVLRFEGTTAPTYVRRVLRRGWASGAILFKSNITSPQPAAGAHEDRCATPARPPARCRSSAPIRRAATSATSSGRLPPSGRRGRCRAATPAPPRGALREAGINVTLAPVADVPTSAGHRARRPRLLERPREGRGRDQGRGRGLARRRRRGHRQALPRPRRRDHEHRLRLGHDRRRRADGLGPGAVPRPRSRRRCR